MNRFVVAFLGLAALGVSACSTVPGVDVTQDLPAPGALPTHIVSADWDVQEIIIDVPAELTVSEANRLKPRADIVWREDPLGDRHAQVQAIMAEAMEFALTPMEGSVPVIVEIEFLFTVRHAETGQALTGPRQIDLTFRALGGQRAIESERNGIFQRDRIQSQVVRWAQQEFGLTPPVPGFTS